MSERTFKATLFVIHVRPTCLQQLFEELEDHIQEEAPKAARIIYTGATKCRQEGVIWLALNREQAMPFANRLSRILENDEDIFAYQEVPLSLFLEQIGAFYQETETERV